MDWVYYLLLIALLWAGWFINILGLPGLWLMVAAHAVYAWITGWDRFVGWPSLIALLALAVLAEIVEFAAGAAGSKNAGGRKRGMIGAIVGGLVGAALFTGLVPIPIVGTIIGVCLGTFIGAALAEYWGRGTMHSLRVGVGAAKGRFWGIVIKSTVGFVMIVVAMIAALPIGAVLTPAASATTTAPATVSSSPTTQTTMPATSRAPQ